MSSGQEKFTPGPWQVLEDETDKDYVRVRGTSLGRKYKIANALIYPNREYGSPEEARANAHLIASAPELYDFLKRIRSYVQDPHDGICRMEMTEEVRDVLGALLSRARGEGVDGHG